MTCKNCTEILNSVNRYGELELYPISCDKIILCEACLKSMLASVKQVKKPHTKCMGCTHECDRKKHEEAQAKVDAKEKRAK